MSYCVLKKAKVYSFAFGCGLIFLYTSIRGIIIIRLQVVHSNFISTPGRITRHVFPPQGCVFLKVRISFSKNFG